MTKPIIVVKVPCKLLYVIQVKEFLIKYSTSWPYLISEFLVAYITIVASDWPRTFFTPKVFLFSIFYYTFIGYSYSYVSSYLELSNYLVIATSNSEFLLFFSNHVPLMLRLSVSIRFIYKFLVFKL